MTMPSGQQDAYIYLSAERYTAMLKKIYEDKQRIGQAFFNALPEEDQRELKGHPNDPFHRDDWPSVMTAIAALQGL